jgi:catechol 2,3-dioxygenase-like lactoylglutathione lyase family enzyme
MGLTSLLDMELAVPAPTALEEFWQRRGMQVTAPGVLGTADRPSQLRLREGAYRHVAELRVACETEADLVDIARRLDGMGIAASLGDGWLRCADPILDHDVLVQVTAAASITPPAPRELNRPGRADRLDRRSTACLGQAPKAPRRLGHVVFGTTDVAASKAFYVDGLGFKVSDSFGDFAYFIRCSADHHNMLLAPSAVPCMNHYAMEMDDIDAIGAAGAQVTAESPEASIAGIGRHVVGANMFWYLLDPAGGMFELYSDMDQIVDDEQWATQQFRDDWNPFEVAAWNSSGIKADFFEPADIAAIAKAREAAGR